MDKKILDLINSQVNKELYSAYLYQDIANFYLSAGLSGFGNWFTIQAQEEMAHAKLFMQFIQNCDEDVVLEAIAAPDKKFSDFLQPLEASLEHEKFVTDSIYKIYEAAQEIKDFRTLNFLEWFIEEQAEEEVSATELIQKYNLFCKDGSGLYTFDAELATRTFSPPSLEL